MREVIGYQKGADTSLFAALTSGRLPAVQPSFDNREFSHEVLIASELPGCGGETIGELAVEHERGGLRHAESSEEARRSARARGNCFEASDLGDFKSSF
jgi:hypothetical protein